MGDPARRVPDAARDVAGRHRGHRGLQHPAHRATEPESGEAARRQERALGQRHQPEGQGRHEGERSGVTDEVGDPVVLEDDDTDGGDDQGEDVSRPTQARQPPRASSASVGRAVGGRFRGGRVGIHAHGRATTGNRQRCRECYRSGGSGLWTHLADAARYGCGRGVALDDFAFGLTDAAPATVVAYRRDVAAFVTFAERNQLDGPEEVERRHLRRYAPTSAPANTPRPPSLAASPPSGGTSAGCAGGA